MINYNKITNEFLRRTWIKLKHICIAPCVANEWESRVVMWWCTVNVVDVVVGTDDIRQSAAASQRSMTSSHQQHRLSLLVVGLITTSCCAFTAVLTLVVVVGVIRHRRRHHHAAASSVHQKSATGTPLITPFRVAATYLPPTSINDHHLQCVLPDVAAKCDGSDVVDFERQHQYDVLETTSTYFWPGGGGGDDSMTAAGGRPSALVTTASRCRCSSCLLATLSAGDDSLRLCSDRPARNDPC